MLKGEEGGSVVRLHLTSDCNMNCSYCYEDKSIDKEYMSLCEFKKLLDIFKKQKISRLYLYGGEPLLNKKIISFLIDLGKLPNNIKELGMTTNGTLLSKEVINYIENVNAHINISIDGIKRVHNKNRFYKNGKGTFNDIFSNMNYINDFSKFNISLTLSPETVNELFDSILLLKKKGFTNFGINFLYEKDWRRTDLKKLILNLRRITKKKLLDYNSFYNELNNINGMTCQQHMLSSITIGPNLEILPCGKWWSSIIRSNNDFNIDKIGYIYEEKLNFKKKIREIVFENKEISYILSNGRICEVLEGENYLRNKYKIEKIIRFIF